MIYLLLSVLSSSAIFILFKSFNRFRVNTLHAIVFNYITAAICGILFSSSDLDINNIINSSWFTPAFILGILFITMFYLMALTAQRNGLSVASVASKMSVIIPIIFGVLVFHESIGIQKLIGIILALLAVYLTSVKQKDQVNVTKALYLPVAVFIGSGVIDTSINYFAPDDNIPLFSATIFSIAAIIGLLIICSKGLSSKIKVTLKSIPFGICLGMVNYASIYFLLKALRVEGFETSAIFTLNNVAIVAFSTLIGLILFKEKLSNKNWIGVVIAMVSIALVSLS